MNDMLYYSLAFVKENLELFLLPDRGVGFAPRRSLGAAFLVTAYRFVFLFRFHLLLEKPIGVMHMTVPFSVSHPVGVNRAGLPLLR